MEAAARSGRIVAVKPLSEGARDIVPLDAAEIEGRLRALAPAPYEPNRADAIAGGRAVSWRANRRPTFCGSPTESNSAARLTLPRDSPRQADRSRWSTDGTGARAIAGVENEAGALDRRVSSALTERAPAKGSCALSTPRAAKSPRAPFDFGSSLVTTSRFELPVELRNEVSRSRDRRRAVRQARPGSSTIARAGGGSPSPPARAPTSPSRSSPPATISGARWSPLRTSSNGTIRASDPVVSLLAERPSVLALADMSVAPGAEHDAIVNFLDKGGVLAAVRGQSVGRRGRRSDSERPSARRTPARRRIVLGDAQAYRSFPAGQPLFRSRRAR